MKLALITLIVAMTSLSANAQRGRRDRDIVFDRRPIVTNSNRTCSYNLEKEEYNWRRNRYVWEVVETFTEYGRYACEDAENLCEDAKGFRWNHRCVKVEQVQSCEFAIETRRGLDNERYVSTGPSACFRAQRECDEDLSRRRRLPGWDSRRVGPHARCVQVTSRPNPRPRPPRMVSASCTVHVYFQTNNGPTRTSQPSVTSTASARTFQEAEQRACEAAKRECEAKQPNTRFFCK